MTRDVQRWFDGSSWTEHTRPLPELALPPRVPPVATHSTGSTTGGAGAAPVAWQPAAAGAWLPGDPPAEQSATTGTAGTSGTGGAGPAGGGATWGATGAASRFGAAAVSTGPGRFGTSSPALGGYAAGPGTSRFGTPAPTGFGVTGVADMTRPGTGPMGSVALRPWVPSGAPAHWGWRVLATVLDEMIVGAPYVVGLLVMRSSMAVGVERSGDLGLVPTPTGNNAFGIGALVTLVLWFVNRVVLQGRTGQSWGKRIVGLRAVHELTERPLGMWWAFVREVAHVVNGVFFSLGYWWPLWDARRQTFSDKLSHTVVLRDPS